MKSAEAAKRLRFVAKTTGGCLGRFDSRLIAQGINTLVLHMEKSNESAGEVVSSHISDTTTFQNTGFFLCGSEPHCPVQDVVQDMRKGKDQD
jgi:cystathionine beta-lyase/cystathionine gamma-synthase